MAVQSLKEPQNSTGSGSGLFIGYFSGVFIGAQILPQRFRGEADVASGGHREGKFGKLVGGVFAAFSRDGVDFRNVELLYRSPNAYYR